MKANKLGLKYLIRKLKQTAKDNAFINIGCYSKRYSLPLASANGQKSEKENRTCDSVIQGKNLLSDEIELDLKIVVHKSPSVCWHTAHKRITWE